ncbi:hypothetical protein AB1Y20_010003 [Prymnesium parvum]|uniref:Uncharacterized protein n=1 Tax=Prymnesium parvum TaxID=97485 RepID=A0AB34K368_PRYPA
MTELTCADDPHTIQPNDSTSALPRKRPALQQQPATPLQPSPLPHDASLGRMTRRQAAELSSTSVPRVPADAAAHKRPRRLPRRRLYSIAFTWPEGASWLSTQGDRKRAPSWYADRVTELVELRAADGASSFVVHVHGSIDPLARAALLSRWRAAFERARGSKREEGGPTLELVVCDKTMPPMWPAAMRGTANLQQSLASPVHPAHYPCVHRTAQQCTHTLVAPLIDDMSEQIVICIDVHDDKEKQTTEIDSLLEQMSDDCRSIGLTAWPGHDLRSSFPRDDPSIAPYPVLGIDRSAADAAEDIVWHLDCGLLISLPGFRRKLRDLKIPPFKDHLAYCREAFEYDPLRGTDEMILEMYLLAARPAMRDYGHLLPAMLCACASLRVHRLCPTRQMLERQRVSKWPEVLSHHLPAYVPRRRRPKQFIYDDEVVEYKYPRTSGAIKLEWRNVGSISTFARSELLRKTQW